MVVGGAGDAAETRRQAGLLASRYNVPVWLPGDAVVELSADRRLKARKLGDGAAWEEVTPPDGPALEPPWFDTSSGLFMAPPRNVAALRLPRGVLTARHAEYADQARLAQQITVPDGLFLARGARAVRPHARRAGPPWAGHHAHARLHHRVHPG
jgi:hypothetical protein